MDQKGLMPVVIILGIFVLVAVVVTGIFYVTRPMKANTVSTSPTPIVSSVVTATTKSAITRASSSPSSTQQLYGTYHLTSLTIQSNGKQTVTPESSSSAMYVLTLSPSGIYNLTIGNDAQAISRSFTVTGNQIILDKMAYYMGVGGEQNWQYTLANGKLTLQPVTPVVSGAKLSTFILTFQK